MVTIVSNFGHWLSGETNCQQLINFALSYMAGLSLPAKRGTFVEFRCASRVFRVTLGRFSGLAWSIYVLLAEVVALRKGRSLPGMPVLDHKLVRKCSMQCQMPEVYWPHSQVWWGAWHKGCLQDRAWKGKYWIRDQQYRSAVLALVFHSEIWSLGPSICQGWTDLHRLFSDRYFL